MRPRWRRSPLEAARGAVPAGVRASTPPSPPPSPSSATAGSTTAAPLEELVAQRLPFEAVAELLWTGVRPQPLDERPRWTAPAEQLDAARRGVAALGPTATPTDRLRAAVVAAAAADPLRHDLRPDAVLHCGRHLLAAVTAALATPTTPAAPTSPATPTTPADSSIAAMLAQAIDRRLPRRWHQPIDLALVCLADHELATSTLAARVAASVRADPTAVVLAGLATLSGPLHGSASVAVQRLLATASDAGAPSAAVADRLRSDGHLPGFGHLVHRHGDPRHRLLLDAIRRTAGANARSAARMAEVDALLAVTAERAPVPPNVDLALGALGHVAGLPLGATELLMAVARTAGWIAHAIEEYGEEPLRFRARATSRPATANPSA
ncbi:MAG: citrate/2-methylcitrate synthase [Acidimicrobiales bacterium]